MRREPAALWFGSDFYEDEQVLQMDYEQQGVYQRLLWISWRNVGIPSDPVVLAKMLGLPAKRFAAQIWPAIAPCWSADSGRLIQKRQEEERARQPVDHLTDVQGDRFLAARRARRVRMLGARRIGRHTKVEWRNLVEAIGGVCVSCRARGFLEKDHIVPVSRGGSDAIDNLQPLCVRCNRSKGTKSSCFLGAT